MAGDGGLPVAYLGEEEHLHPTHYASGGWDGVHVALLHDFRPGMNLERVVVWLDD